MYLVRVECTAKEERYLVLLPTPSYTYIHTYIHVPVPFLLDRIHKHIIIVVIFPPSLSFNSPHHHAHHHPPPPLLPPPLPHPLQIPHHQPRTLLFRPLLPIHIAHLANRPFVQWPRAPEKTCYRVVCWVGGVRREDP